MEVVEVLTKEKPIKICRLQTEIPKLKDDPPTSKARIIIAVNEDQLWNIYIGLDRLDLIPQLKKAAQKEADEIHEIGKRQYKWL